VTERVQSRAELKLACLAVLETTYIMHPAGHQTKREARYVLVTNGDDRIALMFEKGPRSPANLWMRAKHAARIERLSVSRRNYPAEELYAGTDGKGRPIYGRHAALKAMRDLANTDLVCFEIEQIDQLREILIIICADDSQTRGDREKMESKTL
jgi:hypothetical protein